MVPCETFWFRVSWSLLKHFVSFWCNDVRRVLVEFSLWMGSVSREEWWKSNPAFPLEELSKSMRMQARALPLSLISYMISQKPTCSHPLLEKAATKYNRTFKACLHLPISCNVWYKSSRCDLVNLATWKSRVSAKDGLLALLRLFLIISEILIVH